jgi:hypothetical protein
MSTLLATHTTRIYSDGPVQSETKWENEGGAQTESEAEQMMDALQGNLAYLQRQQARRYFDGTPLGGATAHLRPYVEPIMQTTQRPAGTAQVAAAAVPAGTVHSAGFVVGQEGAGFPPGHAVPGLGPNPTAEEVAAWNADQAARAKTAADAKAANQPATDAAIQSAQARDSALATANANPGSTVVVGK